MNWWLSKGNKPEGPFPSEHVAEWLKTGQISPDTMACPEGGTEWKRLSEVDEFSHSVPPPPPPSAVSPAPPPPAQHPVAATVGRGASEGPPRAKFGVLIAAIVLAGCSMLFEALLIGDTWEAFTPLHLLHACIGIAGIITWAIFHYHLWSLIPAPLAETTPGKAVGYLFIPFFNCYWVFRSLIGVNRGLNRLVDAHQLPTVHANVGLAVATGVFFVVAWFFILTGFWLPSFEGLDDPYAFYSPSDQQAVYEEVAAAHVEYNVVTLLLCSAPSFVLWLLMVLNQKRVVEHLLKNGAEVNRASGLIDR